MQNTAVARISLSALRHNLDVVRRHCAHSRVMAMVKADAHGHGLIAVSKALRKADGLAVARMKEALCLRHAGITQRILLLATRLDTDDLIQCSALRIDVTAHDQESVTRILQTVASASLCVWLKLDSGMHRLGLAPRDFVDADRRLRSHTGVSELIHMTHFSSSENPNATATNLQIACFNECHRENPTAPASLANSAALITRPDVHADWVRPGLVLYGDCLALNDQIAVRPVMTLASRVIAVRRIETGEAVGYNERWTCARPSRIATLGIGYGDGYPRHAPMGTPVWINGTLAPLVGRVSMDSCAVDITDYASVSVGDEVVMWGPQLPPSEIAKHCDTVSYSLLSSLTARVDREYTN